jgi:hypothetical protein
MRWKDIITEAAHSNAIFTASVAEIVACNNPLTGWEWDCPPISPDAVRKALVAGQFQTKAWQQVNATLPRKQWVQFHVERIAYLIAHPNQTPINVEVEAWTPDATRYAPRVIDGHRLRIIDGSHRLAAAFLRRDPTMRFTCHESPDDLQKLLPSTTTTAEKTKGIFD